MAKSKWTCADMRAWRRGFTPYADSSGLRLVDGRLGLLGYDEDAWEAELERRADKIVDEGRPRVNSAVFGNHKSNPLIFAWLTAVYGVERVTIFATARNAETRRKAMWLCNKLPPYQHYLGACMQIHAIDEAKKRYDTRFRRNNPKLWRDLERRKKASQH